MQQPPTTQAISSPPRLGAFRHMALRVPDIQAAAHAFAPVVGAPAWHLREAPGWRSATTRGATVGLELVEAAPSALGGLARYGLSHAVFDAPAAGMAGAGLSVHEPLAGYGFADTRAALRGLALAVQAAHAPRGTLLQTPHEPALPVQKLYHTGIVVTDREAAIAEFSAFFGIGHFVRMELHTGDGFAVSLHGQDIEHHALTAFGRTGGFACELMQPGAGDGLYQRFLAVHGEGPQHHFPSILGAGELASAVPRLRACGFAVALDGVFDGLLRYLYLEHADLPGFALELIVPLREDWWQSMGMSGDDAWAIGLDP